MRARIIASLVHLFCGAVEVCCVRTPFTRRASTANFTQGIVRLSPKTVRLHAWPWARAFWVGCFLLGLLVTPCLAVTGQLGDLNGDGVVDVRDLVMLQNHLNGVATLSSNALPLADLNDDGYVTSADVDVLANLILGLPLTILPRPATRCP